MNLAMVQQEVAGWSTEDQDRLAAFLAVIRLKRDPDHVEELGRRLDDKTSESWLSLDTLKRRLGDR